MAVPCRVRNFTKAQFRDTGKCILQYLMILFLYGKKAVELAELSQSHGSMQFRDPEIVSGKRMCFGSPVRSLVIVAMVGIAVAVKVCVAAVGQHSSAFRAGNGFNEIERERARIADAA